MGNSFEACLRTGGYRLHVPRHLAYSKFLLFSGTFMDYKIRLGGTDLRKVSEKHAVDHDIAAIHIYPSYNPANFDHNIALVELHSNVVCDGKYTCTLCLPSPFIMNFGNLSMSVEHQQWIRDDVTQCVVTGWGPKGTGGHWDFQGQTPGLLWRVMSAQSLVARNTIHKYHANYL